MLSRRRRFGSAPKDRSSSRRGRALLAAVAGIWIAAGCGSDSTAPHSSLQVASITIDTTTFQVERGVSVQLTATAHDVSGKIDTIPIAWRSTVDSVASFDRNGVLTAGDTGVTIVSASALGVTSQPIGVHVVWFSAATIAAQKWTPPAAVTPGASLADSVKVLVTNLVGGPAVGALVKFAVTNGGGTVAPAFATVTTTGVVAAHWVLGPNAGTNTVTATVVKADSATLIPWVSGNPASFTVTSYAALTVVKGDNQTAQILSPLPVAPTIKLVDAAGLPRPGVPVTFTPTANGKVANSIVSTGADGVASPGTWTLGDGSGDQQLVVTVEAATLHLHATATGTPVYFSSAQLATSQGGSCALGSDQLVKCLGQGLELGDGDTTSHSTPTPTSGQIHFISLAGASSGAHFCGVATDFSIYCWGVAAGVDANGSLLIDGLPTQVASGISWLQVAPGAQHNCAVANDHTAYCWGIDSNGQLGDNGAAAEASPVAVAGGFKFASLTAGAAHSCGITVDGTAFCWGSNASGQLGDRTTTDRATPTAVAFASPTKVQSIGAGQNWTCALDTAGTAYCWGAVTGQLVPTSYTSAPTLASLSVGAAHACGLTSDGTAYCWGDNSGGQLGDSTTTYRATPTAVATSLRFRSISAGFQHTCGITLDGSVACWGRNSYGEIGVAPPGVQLTPRDIILSVTP